MVCQWKSLIPATTAPETYARILEWHVSHNFHSQKIKRLTQLHLVQFNPATFSSV
jgi:hypothetical protein